MKDPKKEIMHLVIEGVNLLNDQKRGLRVSPLNYQSWYSKAFVVIRQLMLERLREFEELYKIKNRNEIDLTTFTINDYLLGVNLDYGVSAVENFNPENLFINKFNQQLGILVAAKTRLDSLLVNIKGSLRADIFDNEINAARSLLHAQHIRAAGTIAGIVLKRHLSSVCDDHRISSKKENPTLAEYNDLLKNEGVLNVPRWRWIRRLTDIRNLCCYSKDREPTYDEVKELIDGAEKVIKTIF